MLGATVPLGESASCDMADGAPTAPAVVLPKRRPRMRGTVALVAPDRPSEGPWGSTWFRLRLELVLGQQDLAPLKVTCRAALRAAGVSHGAPGSAADGGGSIGAAAAGCARRRLRAKTPCAGVGAAASAGGAAPPAAHSGRRDGDSAQPQGPEAAELGEPGESQALRGCGESPAGKAAALDGSGRRE